MRVGIWLFTCASLLAACGSDEPSTPTGTLVARAVHYDFTIDLATGVASSTVLLKAETDGNCVVLPFRAVALTEATFNGQPASGEVSADTFTACGDGVMAGDDVLLTTKHTVPPATLEDSQVGFSTNADRDGNPFTYLVSWVEGCDRFGPCDNRPNLFARYRLRTTHDADTQVACAGSISKPSVTETICDFEFDGGPTYSTFGIVAGKGWQVEGRPQWDGIAVEIYDHPSTGMSAKIDDAVHGSFMAFLQSNFGKFPYGSTLRVLTGPTYWSGFEHPGNIVLSDALARTTQSRYARPVEHVLNHEIAHQWAGDQTTLAGTYDFVWKEAMAEYLTFVFEDQQDPANGLRTANAWKRFSQGAMYYPAPQDQPRLFDYYGDVYGQGPMVFFRQLEVLTSRDQVMQALRMVLGTPRALSVDELLAALSQTTGLDLTAYSQAWIKGQGAPLHPVMQATFTPAAGQSTLAISQTNLATAGAKPCKFTVALRGAAPADEVLVAVDTFRNGPDQSLTVNTPAFTVSQVVIDPFAECLVGTAAADGRTDVAPRAHPWLAPAP